MNCNFASSSIDRCFARLGRYVCLVVVVAANGCQYTSQGKNAAGVKYFQQGQYQQAAQFFQQAVVQDPQNGDAYYNLASAYHQIGRINKDSASLNQAELLYNKALDLNENNRDAYRALAVLLVDKNQPDKAQTLLAGWQQKFPTIAAPRVELARLREEFGDKQGAKEYLQQALATDPYDTRALAALGRLQEQSGETVQALQNYQRSLYRDQFQPEVAARVAQLRSVVNAGNQVTTPGGTRTVITPTNNAIR